LVYRVDNDVVISIDQPPRDAIAVAVQVDCIAVEAAGCQSIILPALKFTLASADGFFFLARVAALR